MSKLDHLCHEEELEGVVVRTFFVKRSDSVPDCPTGTKWPEFSLSGHASVCGKSMQDVS